MKDVGPVEIVTCWWQLQPASSVEMTPGSYRKAKEERTNHEAFEVRILTVINDAGNRDMSVMRRCQKVSKVPCCTTFDSTE